MIKRIATWLTGIFRTELQKVETDAAGLYPHVTAEIAALRKELANATANLATLTKGLELAMKHHVSAEIAAVKTQVAAEVASTKSHVSAEVVRPVELIKTSVVTEISGQFEKILAATGSAAKEALADARKTLRMPCDICKLLSWKFTVNPEGKVICGDCQIKGKA